MSDIRNRIINLSPPGIPLNIVHSIVVIMLLVDPAPVVRDIVMPFPHINSFRVYCLLHLYCIVEYS